MVCEGIFGERSVPLILMYGASELNAAHEEVLERRAVDDSIPWKALYVLLRRMAGKQLTVRRR